MSEDHVTSESWTDDGVTLLCDWKSGTEWVRVDMNRWTDTLSLIPKAMKKQIERRGEYIHGMKGVIQDLSTLVWMCQGKTLWENNLVASPKESPSFTVQAKVCINAKFGRCSWLGKDVGPVKTGADAKEAKVCIHIERALYVESQVLNIISDWSWLTQWMGALECYNKTGA